MSDRRPGMPPPEIERFLDVLALALPPRSAVFLSGPLASGPRRYAGDAVDADEVRRRNAREMDDFAARLRVRLGKPVISPAGLHVPGWRGRDYGELFRRVIERFAVEVWLMEGWELSTGSVREIATCFGLGIPCLDHSGEPVDHPTAVRKVRQALDMAAASGVDCASLEASFQTLESL